MSRMKITYRRFASFTLLTMVTGLLAASSQAASAYSAAEFDPGYIVSDAVFFNSSSLNEQQIQSFIESKEANCTPAGGVPCLRNYVTETTSRTASAGGQCSAYAGATSERASRIIYKVSQACGINPQVLMVLLEKEQGLVSSPSPSAGKYRIATGYGCPDTAQCDAKYYGLYNQLYMAAWQFKEYAIDPNYWHYRVGTVAVQYSPDAINCAAPNVNIRNVGTAALYNYTPYQPNASALANLHGTGDSCSSYGNRNFWVFFNDWFGSPVGQVNPIAVLDAVRAVPGGVRVSGWAFDPDTSASIAVHVYVNGVGVAESADTSRADVAAAYGLANDNHGFDATIAVTGSGPQEVCVYAINQGPGSNVTIGCVSVATPTGPPTGYLDSVTAKPGLLNLSGWTLDPDTASSIGVHIYVDSKWAAGVTADQPRGDIATAFPGYGAPHGYSSSIAVSGGRHDVCTYGLNVGPGYNNLLGCRSVFVPGGSPTGVIDAVSGGIGSLSISGWTIDPDTAQSIPVHIYVDGTGRAFTASSSRPDVGNAFPAYGDAHGFSEVIQASPGTHNVCAYGINTVGSGGNSLLGCRTVTVG